MDVICAPMGLVNVKYPKQGIADIAIAGFKDILLELSMFCPAGELEEFGQMRKRQRYTVQSKEDTGIKISEHPSELHKGVKSILDICEKADLVTTIACAPYLSKSTKRDDLNGILLCLARESVKVCQEAGCGYIIVKPLFAGVRYEDRWTINKKYYLDLADMAEESNIKILLENQCQDINGHLVRGICSDAAEAAAWIDRLNAEAKEERFGFCMDVGTCCLCGQNMQEFARSLGKRLKAVILRDCDGHREASLLPFTYSGFQRSGTDWLGLIRGLREIDFDGQLILNFATTAASFSPLLRPHLMELAKEVGEYFKWQIGIENLLKKYKSIVLFGAGNMCRNYMKCYGEKYPPLFTCDNNKKLWGSEFCGLEVKPPASLKELPEDCAIFICNIYYREIERQLRDMGICNEIEYFSDEFMPSFYYDRLER